MTDGRVAGPPAVSGPGAGCRGMATDRHGGLKLAARFVYNPRLVPPADP
jgi:hypothetical protein